MRRLVQLAVVGAATLVGSVASAQQADTPYATQPVYTVPPPPQSAQAGNGEYVAPLQQQTQQTYVPQSVALSGPPVIKNWSEGDPIPPGYHPQSRMRGGLIGGGFGLWGPLYLISAIGGAACIDGKVNGGMLLIPVAGPFLEIPNAGGNQGGAATAITFLLIDGIGQAAGAAMIIAGFTWPKWVLVRNDLGSGEKKTQAATLEPVVGPGQTGLKLTF